MAHWCRFRLGLVPHSGWLHCFWLVIVAYWSGEQHELECWCWHVVVVYKYDGGVDDALVCGV